MLHLRTLRHDRQERLQIHSVCHAQWWPLQTPAASNGALVKPSGVQGSSACTPQPSRVSRGYQAKFVPNTVPKVSNKNIQMIVWILKMCIVPVAGTCLDNEFLSMAVLKKHDEFSEVTSYMYSVYSDRSHVHALQAEKNSSRRA